MELELSSWTEVVLLLSRTDVVSLSSWTEVVSQSETEGNPAWHCHEIQQQDLYLGMCRHLPWLFAGMRAGVAQHCWHL